MYKMEKIIIKFGDIETQKQKFHQQKGPISIKNMDINKIVVYNKVSFGKKGFKYFIGYKDPKRVRPLCIFLPKMSAYRRDFDETKYIYFLIKHDELFKKIKVKNSLKKEFDSEPIYNQKYLKPKVKFYNGKIKRNFHNNIIPKEGFQLICLPVILIDSVFRTDKNYYSQAFLEECKYVVKEKKIPKYIIDDTEVSSDSDRENSDEENSDEESYDEQNSNEENSDDENSDEKNSDEEK